MTVVTMSLFPSPHSSSPHSILSATLSAKSSQSLLAASNGKGKLGFSIDSIVGDGSPARDVVTPGGGGRSQSPIQTSPRDRSPIYRVRSPSPADDYRRSPSPSASPPSPSLVRPIPTSLPGSTALSTQSYLDQLQQLKAFYEARGGGAPGLGSVPSSGSGSPLLPPGLTIPGLHPAAVLSALPRPPNMPGPLPPFLGLPGQPHSLPGQPLPREYPLYPWFINRHRFPGEFLLPFRKPKRIRTAFSPSQLLKLEQAFEKNQYVVGQERKELAKSLNLSETQVKVWFQNRRTKHKREETETDQQKALSGQPGGHHMEDQTILEHEESEEEDIDCE